MDYVILNNPDNLSRTILSEMKEIRQDKGMKTLYAVNYDAIEDEYAVYVEEWNATHTPEVPDEGEETQDAESGEVAETPEEPAEQPQSFDEFLGERTDY